MSNTRKCFHEIYIMNKVITNGCGRGKGMGTPAMTPYREAVSLVTSPAGLKSTFIWYEFPGVIKILYLKLIHVVHYSCHHVGVPISTMKNWSSASKGL